MKASKRQAIEEVARQTVLAFMADAPPKRARPRRSRAAKAPAANAASAVATPAAKRMIKISPEAMALARSLGAKPAVYTPPNYPGHPFFCPQPAPGVLPQGRERELAMDAGGSNIQVLGDWAGTAMLGGGPISQGVTFLGYPFLSELAQRPEFRVISETIATEMTRKWVKVQAGGDEGAKSAKIKQVNDELVRLRVRDAFRKIAEQDGFFGRSHLYLDTGDGKDHQELVHGIGDGRDSTSKAKIGVRPGQRKLRAVRTVEPVWTYPWNYDSTDPLDENFYKPRSWFVMGKEVHASRLLTFVGREVPDILKPAYAFGGLSLSQMAMPYVHNWLRTRDSVSELVHSFVVWGLKTNLQTQIQPGGDIELLKRADFFNMVRDNRGLMLVDQASEEFFNVTTPLGSLDTLQAQAQEQMAAISRIPLVKLLGIAPHGLNASAEGEIRVFYDSIHAYQEAFFTINLRRVIDLVMLSLWGEVDEQITFTYEPLWSLDEKGEAEVRKTEAETGQVLVNGGIISPREERRRVANEPDGPYQGLDVDDLPDLKEEEQEGLEPHGAAAKIVEGEEGELPGQHGAAGEEDDEGEDENGVNGIDLADIIPLLNVGRKKRRDEGRQQLNGHDRGEPDRRAPPGRRPPPGRRDAPDRRDHRMLARDQAAELPPTVGPDERAADEFKEENVKRDAEDKFSSTGGGGDLDDDTSF